MAYPVLPRCWSGACPIDTLAPNAQILQPREMAASDLIPNLGSFLAHALKRPRHKIKTRKIGPPELGYHAHDNPILEKPGGGHSIW